jgi:hypothetical protein
MPFFEAEAKKRQTGRPKSGEKKSAPNGAPLKHRAADAEDLLEIHATRTH